MNKGHSMSSQPPDGQHVTDLAKILHTIWDMKKKIPEPEYEHSETSEAGDMALESFRYFEISRTASSSNGSNFFVLEDSSKKKFSFEKIITGPLFGVKRKNIIKILFTGHNCISLFSASV